MNMSGFAVDDMSKPETKRVCLDPEYLTELFIDGSIPWPDLDDADIEDRSKADWLIKLISSLQILWFVAQILGRAVNSLSVSTLELFTLANVGCGAIMYVLRRISSMNLYLRH